MVRLAGVQLARDTSEQTRASLSPRFAETKACSTTRAKSEKCALQSRAERYRLGKTLRSKVSRESHADYAVTDKRDPVTILSETNQTRIPELLPIRYERATGFSVASPANKFALTERHALLRAQRRRSTFAR